MIDVLVDLLLASFKSGMFSSTKRVLIDRVEVLKEEIQQLIVELTKQGV